MDVDTSLIPPFDSPEKIEKEKQRLWRRWGFARLLGRDDQSSCIPPDQKQEPQLPRPGFGRRLSRKVVPSLPRPGTFRRQNSERREKLKKVEQPVSERRTVSVERRRALSARPASPPPVNVPQFSAPEIRERLVEDGYSRITRRETWPETGVHSLEDGHAPSSYSPPLYPTPPPDTGYDPNEQTPSEGSREDNINEEIREELEQRWILNLSMHFRDQSPREKFFLTFAETPQKWRRITISCDYRNVPLDSLERDLQDLQFQRDKSARIYESIRLSLPDIKFYDTVTNLKLETRDDRLHVHVTEDTHEIIPYPSVQAVQHIKCARYRESQLHFEAHMSGFVYKVKVVTPISSNIWIKKEIPGPDSVDEFLYEINALNELKDSKSVIQFKGLVVDDDQLLVKGLLIAFAEQGAVVDILYDHKGDLPWPKREKWAKQIVQGLSEIHEAGFVQGDFTLSNIVVDGLDEAKIIDINRRGCPVGWEPPEIRKLVDSSQRISMYIGVKSDLFQLGMVLWALAKEVDEPEREKRPLLLRDAAEEVPQYFRNLVNICLSPQPRNRLSAGELLRRFPSVSNIALHPLSSNNPRDSFISSDGLVAESRRSSTSYDRDAYRERQFSRGDYAYDSRPGSVDIPFDGRGSCIVSRGRQPPRNTAHLSISESTHGVDGVDMEPQTVSVSPHRNGGRRWEEIEMNGTQFLLRRDSSHHDNEILGEHDRGRDTARHHEPEASKRDLSHVDSGLGDMENMELVGVGGHETLRPDLGPALEAGIGLNAGIDIADFGKTKKEEVTNAEPESLKL